MFRPAASPSSPARPSERAGGVDGLLPQARTDHGPARSVVRRAGVDATRRPDVARLPAPRPVRTAVAWQLVHRALGRLSLVAPAAAGAPAGSTGPGMTLHDPDAFHRRIGCHGLIGFGESSTAGEGDSDDLPGVLTVLASHVDDLVPAPLHRLRPLWRSARPRGDRNTRDGARRNVHRRYDLSNELFAAFLDPTLTYSSALFPSFPARFDSLAAAQHRKIDRLPDLARVGEGTRLLEIGTGWGELALRAITMGHRQMLHTASSHTWISKYVFPGGLIPSREAVAEHSAAAGLRTLADDGHGAHYAETLRLWRERFAENRQAVTALGFDAVFQRMWEFYPAYSEAGFRSRCLDVRQILLAEGADR